MKKIRKSALLKLALTTLVYILSIAQVASQKGSFDLDDFTFFIVLVAGVFTPLVSLIITFQAAFTGNIVKTKRYGKFLYSALFFWLALFVIAVFSYVLSDFFPWQFIVMVGASTLLPVLIVYFTSQYMYRTLLGIAVLKSKR